MILLSSVPFSPVLEVILSDFIEFLTFLMNSIQISNFFLLYDDLNRLCFVSALRFLVWINNSSEFQRQTGIIALNEKN